MEKLGHKKNNLIDQNNKLNKLNTEIDTKNKLLLDKTKFIDRLESKISKLSNKTILTQMKYSYYKWFYDLFNIIIILISSILTIIETIKNEIDYETANESVKYFFKLCPIVLSTLIIIITSILKFLRFQENLEIMARTTEKSILTIYRMKKLQEETHFANIDELNSIQKMYLDEIFLMYNQCQADISKCFKLQDLIKYENKLKKSILQGKNESKKIKEKFKNNNEDSDTFSETSDDSLGDEPQRLFASAPMNSQDVTQV